MNAECVPQVQESSLCHDIIVSLRNSKKNASKELDYSSFTTSLPVTPELQEQNTEFSSSENPKVNGIFYGTHLNVPYASVNCLVSQKIIQNLHNKRKHRLIHDTFRLLIKGHDENQLHAVNFVFQLQEVQYLSATNHVNHIDFIIKP